MTATSPEGINLDVIGYDLAAAIPAPPQTVLGNISTRGLVKTGDEVLIGGFIVTGRQPKEVIVRAIGPSLPVSGVLLNPYLELHDPSGAVIASNDDWRSTQEAAIIATGLASDQRQGISHCHDSPAGFVHRPCPRVAQRVWRRPGRGLRS